MNTTDISEKMEGWQRQASETCRNVSEATDRYVHENTWTSIACAAVLGCVVGYIFASGRD